MLATPPKRGACEGWSAHAIRRNLLFLYSVDERGLEGLQGAAFTLTVRDCPPSAQDWQRARDALFDAMRREGFAFVHWVTEWQARGVPHLHMAVYWPAGVDAFQSGVVGRVLIHWYRIAAPWGPKPQGQHVALIYDVLGWNQYQAKHAARGLKHYQRQGEAIPQSWRGVSTGRMWGKLGDWPVVEPLKVAIDRKAYWAYRRLVRSWRIANARSHPLKVQDERGRYSGTVPDTRRIRSARGMLRCPHRELSACRGVSEWLPEGVNLAFIANLADRGFDIEPVL